MKFTANFETHYNSTLSGRKCSYQYYTQPIQIVDMRSHSSSGLLDIHLATGCNYNYTDGI